MILEIRCEEVLLNFKNLKMSARKAFEVLLEGLLVSQNGAGGN